MYFSEDENRRTLASLLSLMKNEDSQLWIDCVDNAVVKKETDNTSILAFLDGMAELGEEFIFGFTDPVAWLNRVGFSKVTVETCGEYIDDSDPVLSKYAFALAQR